MRLWSIDAQTNAIALNLRDLDGDFTIDHQGLAHFSGQNQHDLPSLLKAVLFQRAQPDVVTAESTSRRDQVRKSDLTLNIHFYSEMQKIQELVSGTRKTNSANNYTTKAYKLQESVFRLFGHLTDASDPEDFRGSAALKPAV